MDREAEGKRTSGTIWSRVLLVACATLGLLSVSGVRSAAWAQPGVVGTRQSPDRLPPEEWRRAAREILDRYGAMGRLSAAGMRRYLAVERFKQIDKRADGRLDIDEYAGAFLYCREARPGEWICDIDQLRARWREDTSDGKVRLDVESLTARSPMWQRGLDLAVEGHWNRAKGNDPAAELGEDALARYLEREAERTQRPRGAEERMRALQRTGSKEPIDRDREFRELLALELFEDLDRDGNEHLDISEFMPRLPFLRAFAALAGPDFYVSRDEFHRALRPEPAWEDVFLTLDDLARDTWQKYVGGEGRRPAEAVKAALAKIEEDETTVLLPEIPRVLGFPRLPGRGIVLLGRVVTDEDNRVLLDPSQWALMLRVVQKFLDAGDNATAATLSYSRTASSASDVTNFSFDGALRFDWYIPGLYPLLRPAAGLEWTYSRIKNRDLADRSKDTEEKTDTRRFYLSADVTLLHDFPVWRASGLQIGPVFESDEQNDINRVAGFVEWEPRFRLGGYSTGVWRWLDSKGVVQVYLAPRAGIELGEIVSSKQKTPDASFLRYGIRVGLRLFKRLHLTYALTQRNSLDDLSRDFTFHEVTGEWAFDDEDTYVITGGYRRGRDTPAFQDVEEYNIGLGVKF